MPLYSSLVRHQIAGWVFLEICARLQGNSRETFAEKWRVQLFVLQRENKMNTSDTFTKPTTFPGLIQMVHVKCISAPVTQVYTSDSKSYL